MVDAFQYVRSRRGLGLVALTTIGVVVIGFPYLTFLPTLADERYGVGAGGYGVMAGVAGLGAVSAGVVLPRTNLIVQRPWLHDRRRRAALGVSLIALAAAEWFWTALVALAAVGAAGLVFQTTTQSLMLSLSDVDYHGRMQSMVVLGFSGFGLAALPLGLLADAITLEVTLALDGPRPSSPSPPPSPSAAATTAANSSPSNSPDGDFVIHFSGHGWPPIFQRSRRRRRAYVVQSTPVRVTTQCSAMRPSTMRCSSSQVTSERSPVSRLMPRLVALVHTWSPSTVRWSMVVSTRDSTRWNSARRPL